MKREKNDTSGGGRVSQVYFLARWVSETLESEKNPSLFETSGHLGSLDLPEPSRSSESIGSSRHPGTSGLTEKLPADFLDLTDLPDLPDLSDLPDRPVYIYLFGENKEWNSTDNLKIFGKVKES